MRTRLTPTSLKIKMTVRLFRPVAEEDRLRLVATDAGWRVRGPLHARDFDFACEGRWTRGGELLPAILRWDFDAVARFVIDRYLDALRALQARPEQADNTDGGGIDPAIDPAELRALVADLEREGERRLGARMRITRHTPTARTTCCRVEIEPVEIEPLEIEP